MTMPEAKQQRPGDRLGLVSVLWHPEGTAVDWPVLIQPAVDGGKERYYAMTNAGSWWRLSDPDPSEKYGSFHVGAVRVLGKRHEEMTRSYAALVGVDKGGVLTPRCVVIRVMGAW